MNTEMIRTTSLQSINGFRVRTCLICNLIGLPIRLMSSHTRLKLEANSLCSITHVRSWLSLLPYKTTGMLPYRMCTSLHPPSGTCYPLALPVDHLLAHPQEHRRGIPQQHRVRRVHRLPMRIQSLVKLRTGNQRMIQGKVRIEAS